MEDVGTPLHIAAQMGHFEIFKFILEHSNVQNPTKNVHGVDEIDTLPF
jgi:ankyrin repeat protein